MIHLNSLIAELIEGFNKKADSLPYGFYSTWEYTETGNNYSHSVTLGILISELEKLLPDCFVSIDTRFNSNAKFQPDITMLDNKLRPVLFLDYESPNSSDARVPIKDIDAYNAFCNSIKSRIPYLVLTTLPNDNSPEWQLRYYSPGYYNDGYKEHRSIIRENPFKFWYNFYQRETASRNIENIFFLNIDDKELRLVLMDRDV